jgi:hypothetical protein
MIAATPGGQIVDATALLKEFCSAVERRDGKAFASLFTEDGVYNDVFYGAFKGRDFRWDMHRPVSNGEMLYAYYTFSYVSKLPEADGKRVGFEGVSMMKLSDGKIAEYREVANVGPAFVELGFAAERTARILAKEGAHLKKQPEFQRHLA